MSKFTFTPFASAPVAEFTFTDFGDTGGFVFSDLPSTYKSPPSPAAAIWQKAVAESPTVPMSEAQARHAAPMLPDEQAEGVATGREALEKLYFWTFKQVFPQQARRVEEIADDPSVLLQPWKRAAENMRARGRKPIWEPGLDWGAMGNWLWQGGKAVLSTFGENIGPILKDVNIPARVLGPIVEAVAQTEEHAPYSSPANEVLLMLQKSPEIAKKAWEIFVDVQLKDGDADLVKQAVAAYVDKGVIEPDNAGYLAAFFGVFSNPVIMHSVLTRDLPALEQAIKRRFPNAMAKMQARASLIEKGVDLDSGFSIRAALSGWRGKLSRGERAFLKSELAKWQGRFGMGVKGRGFEMIDANRWQVENEARWLQAKQPRGMSGVAGFPHERPPLMSARPLINIERPAPPEILPVSVIKQAAPTPVPATQFEQPAWFQPTGLVGPAKDIMGAEIVDALAVTAEADMLVTRVPPVPATLAETPGAPAAPEADIEGKQPWEMTRDEFRAYCRQSLAERDLPGAPNQATAEAHIAKQLEAFDVGAMDDTVWRYRREHIQRALAEGKPVPAEVLADYPDLAHGAEAEAPESPTAQRVIADAEAHLKALDTAVANGEHLPAPPDYPDDERAPELPVKYVTVQPTEEGVTARLANIGPGIIRNPVVTDIVKETGADLYIERTRNHDNLYIVKEGKIVAGLRRGMRGWRPRIAGPNYKDVAGQTFAIEGIAPARETDGEAIDELMADLASMKIRDLDDEVTKFYAGLPPASELWDAKTEFVNWLAGMVPPNGLRTRSDIANMQIGALMGDIFGVLNKHEFMAARARDYWVGQSERLRHYLKHPARLKGKLANIWRDTPLTDDVRMEVYRGVEDPDARDLSEWQRKEARKFAERMNRYFEMAVDAGLMDSDWFRDNYFSHVIVGWSHEPGGEPMPAKEYGRYAPGWKKKQFFQHRRRFAGTIEELETNGVEHTAPDGSSKTLYPIFVKDPAIIEPLYVMALGRGIAMQSVMSGLYGLPTATGYNGVVNKNVFASMPENTREKYRRLDIAGLSKWRVIDKERDADGTVRLIKLAEQELYINKELYEPLAQLANVPIDEPLPIVGKIWGKLAALAKRATLFLTPVHFATLLSYALVAPSGFMLHPLQVANTLGEFGSLWERDDPELVEAVNAGLPLPQLGNAETEIRRGLMQAANFKQAAGVISQAFRRFTETWVGKGLYNTWRTLKLPLDAWDFVLFDRLLGSATWENYKYARDFYLDKGYDRKTAVRMAVEEASTFMGALQKVMTSRKGNYWARRAFLASSFRRANIDTLVKAISGKGYGWKFRPVQGAGGTGEGGGMRREPTELRKLQNQVARRAMAKILKGILWAIIAADIQTLAHYMMRWREEGKRPDPKYLWDALKRNALTGGIHVYTTDFDRAGRGLRHVNVVFRPMTEPIRWMIRFGQQAVSILNPFTRAAAQLAGNILGISPSVDPNLPPKRRAIEMAKEFLRNTTFYGRMPYELGGSKIPRTPKEHFLIWAGIYPSAYEPHKALLDPLREKEALLAADRADARLRAWRRWLEGDDAEAMKLLLAQYPPKRAAEIMRDFGKMSRTWWAFRQLPADMRLQWFMQMPPEEQDAFMEAVAEEMFIRAEQEAKLHEKQ